MSSSPDGGRRVHNHHRKSPLGPPFGDVLGVVLALLVVADDLLRGARASARRPVIRRPSARARRPSWCRRPARHLPPPPPAGCSRVPSTLTRESSRGSLRPEAIVGGAVEDRLARPTPRERAKPRPSGRLRPARPGGRRGCRAGSPAAPGSAPRRPAQQGPHHVGTDEPGAAGDEIHRRAALRREVPGDHPDDVARVLGSSMTTDASKPECIAQFWHSGSCRDSQYAQSVPFQNSFQVADVRLPDQVAGALPAVRREGRPCSRASTGSRAARRRTPGTSAST